MWNKQLISPINPTSLTLNRTANDLFNLSFLFYNQIQIGIIKQNLGTLLWHTFIRSRIVTLTQLIEKIGKIPKDRLCYKELRLNEQDLIIFLEQLSKKFFNTFIESIYNQLNEIPIFNIDDVWQSNTIGISPDQLGMIVELLYEGTSLVWALGGTTDRFLLEMSLYNKGSPCSEEWALVNCTIEKIDSKPESDSEKKFFFDSDSDPKKFSDSEKLRQCCKNAENF
jgi:hypothetical protein